MYGIGGERELTERTLDHLSGWRGARPVRVGNGAWNQRQHDVWGMILDAVDVQFRRNASQIVGPCGLRRRLAPGMFDHDRLLASSLHERTCLAWTMRLLLSEPPSASALTLVTRAAHGAARRPLQIEVHRLRLPSGRLGLSVPVSQGH